MATRCCGEGHDGPTTGGVDTIRSAGGDDTGTSNFRKQGTGGGATAAAPSAWRRVETGLKNDNRQP